MTINGKSDAKQIAIEKLAALGARLPANATLEKIAEVIGLATGVHKPYYTRTGDFVQAFAYPPKASKSEFNIMKRDPFTWKLAGNPRADRLDADQPAMLTPNGIGNGAERQHGYARGA